MKEVHEMLLEEFDANRQAIINPQDLHQPIEGFPKVVISCFSRVTFARLLENYDHEVIARTSMANFEVWSMGSLSETNRLVPLMHQLGLLPVWGL
jgi:pnp/udp family phosphorylase